jgi:hypothetical protein
VTTIFNKIGKWPLHVSTRRKPPCRGECAFDLNGACMSAAKIRGSQLYGDHHC